jgi:hypothetical protein
MMAELLHDPTYRTSGRPKSVAMKEASERLVSSIKRSRSVPGVSEEGWPHYKTYEGNHICMIQELHTNEIN